MRILHVLPALDNGGVERGVTDLAMMQKKHGHDVWVSSSGGRFCRTLANAGIPHLTQPWHKKNPFTWPARARLLAQLVRQHRIQMLHPHSRVPYWISHLSRRYHDCPMITTCYGLHGLGPLGVKKCYNRSILLGDRVIATSRVMQNYLTEHYGLDESNISLIHRGVNVDDFQRPNTTSINKLRALWQLDERPLLLFPARISEKKGQMTLLTALQHLASIPLQVVLIGKVNQQAYQAAMQQAIHRAQPQHTIQYQHNCDDMSSAYALADLVINAPIHPEPFGRIPLEAGICQRITIAPRAGGFLETIVDQRTGFHFTPNDPADLAARIQHVLQLSPDAKETIQRQAYTHVLSHFTLNKMYEATMSVYKELVPETAQSAV